MDLAVSLSDKKRKLRIFIIYSISKPKDPDFSTEVWDVVGGNVHKLNRIDIVLFPVVNPTDNLKTHN